MLPDGEGAYTQPARGDPRVARLSEAGAVLGCYTADNLDYVLRDAHVRRRGRTPTSTRILYYSFVTTPEGLTLDRSGAQALLMFLTARLLHVHERLLPPDDAGDRRMHLKEIFPAERCSIVFPWDLRQRPAPYLDLTEWTLLG